MLNRRIQALAGGLLLVLTGCQTAYYGAMEKVGVHKRDILVNRIEDARDEQEEAKEQFKTALQRFEEVVAFEGGELKTIYERLNKEFERSEAQANDVRQSIKKVEDVSNALFIEWQEELDLYSSSDLRRQSEQQLRDTHERYARLMSVMKQAESRLDPVLVTFRDHVLFLKHNLNAQAISSLHNELDGVEADVARLIREMEAAIAEADAFISEMGRT